MFTRDEEITFDVQRDEESGWLVASWDDPDGGGITTQGQDLDDLQEQIPKAVTTHFDKMPGENAIRIKLSFS